MVYVSRVEYRSVNLLHHVGEVNYSKGLLTMVTRINERNLMGFMAFSVFRLLILPNARYLDPQPVKSGYALYYPSRHSGPTVYLFFYFTVYVDVYHAFS